MINLTILNLKEKVFEGEVKSITLPGEQGELTVLPNHVPIITALKEGSISVSVSKSERYEGTETLRQAQGKQKYFESKGGIFEFTNNQATILL